MKISDRYLKIVEWSDTDNCYIGVCPGLMLGGVHGDDESAVYQELCRAVEEWIVIMEKDGDPLPPATAGKQYSGKFVLRVGKDIHKELAIEAIRHGESLNSYCLKVFRERRRHINRRPMARQRSVRGVTRRKSRSGRAR